MSLKSRREFSFRVSFWKIGNRQTDDHPDFIRSREILVEKTLFINISEKHLPTHIFVVDTNYFTICVTIDSHFFEVALFQK